MAWTNVAKPTSTTYTQIIPQGKQIYDDPNLTYDDASAFYDSVNQLQWTNVAKPTVPAQIAVGMATGLLMPLTYSTAPLPKDKWTRVAKPTS